MVFTLIKLNINGILAKATYFMIRASYSCKINYFNFKILTDTELINGCKKEDAHCQKNLFNRYANTLLGVCNRYARNKEDGEDILQDAFIKIFRKIDQFKGEGSFEGWMRRIVVNTALKKYTISRYSKEFTVSEVKDNTEASMDDVYSFNNLSAKDILALIHKLPDGYRMIFNLYVVEGYQHDEIAQMLGIQAGTSRSQLVKARQMLQKEIVQIQKVAV